MSSIKVIDFNPISWDGKVCPPTSPMSRYNLDNILKNYSQNFDGIFELIIEVGNGDTNVELETNIGITSSFITACECLGATFYSASVLFASISVEQILNHDVRLETERQNTKYEWLDLDVKNLETAYNKGLPTNLLLNDNENFKMKTVEFVDRRNKVAHGDTEGFRRSKLPKKIEFGVQYTNTWEPTVEDALIQINKAKSFIEKWGEENLSYDYIKSYEPTLYREKK